MVGKGKFTARSDAASPSELKEPAQKRETRPTIKGSGFVQRAYYISDEVFKKIKILAVLQDRDASSVVREALDEYLKGK